MIKVRTRSTLMVIGCQLLFPLRQNFTYVKDARLLKWLLPSRKISIGMIMIIVVMGIGYYHPHRTLFFLPEMLRHQPSVGLGLYVGSSSQAAGAGSIRRLRLQLVLIVLYSV
jgi:hypothetical protein